MQVLSPVLGEATCQGREHLRSPCWVSRECKGLSTLDLGQLHCGNVSLWDKEQSYFPLVKNKAEGSWAQCPLSGQKPTQNSASTWPVCVTCMGFGEQKELLVLLAELSLAQKSCVFVSLHENRNRLIYELVSTVKSQTLTSSCLHLATLASSLLRQELSPICRVLCLLFPSCGLLSPEGFTGPVQTFLKPQTTCHLLEEAFLTM